MTLIELAPVLVALGFGGALVAVINAIFQRRKVGADATAVVTAAARELIDPLRRELAAERANHAITLQVERDKIAEVRLELQAAMTEARALRVELASTRRETDELRHTVARYQRRIAELEALKERRAESEHAE